MVNKISAGPTRMEYDAYRKSTCIIKNGKSRRCKRANHPGYKVCRKHFHDTSRISADFKNYIITMAKSPKEYFVINEPYYYYVGYPSVEEYRTNHGKQCLHVKAGFKSPWRQCHHTSIPYFKLCVYHLPHIEYESKYWQDENGAELHKYLCQNEYYKIILDIYHNSIGLYYDLALTCQGTLKDKEYL